MSLDFAGLNAALLGRAHGLLPEWFPAGRLKGHEFLVGDLSGKAGDSLSININTGRWADFASGEKGGDLISLYAAIHRLDQGAAAKQLGAAAPTAATSKPSKKDRDVIMPVPESAPRCTCQHYKYGNPSNVWEYRDADGGLLGYVARYNPPGERKQIVPWTFAKDGWGMGNWPDPRPLYGLDDLAKRDGQVLLVEGEKSADAARRLIPSMVVLTWPGGSSAWRKAGWDCLKGRSVVLWPDADEPGTKCMWELGHHLLKLCPTVKLILPDDHKDGWDAADALAEGWDFERFKAWTGPRIQQVTESAGATVGAVYDRAPKVAGNGAAARPVLVNPLPKGSSQAAVTKTEENSPAPQSQVSRWMAWNLDRTNNGMPVANLNNAVSVLEHDPTLKSLVWYDEFLQRLLTQYRRGDDVLPPREWTEADDINLALYMQRTIGLSKIGKDIVSQAVIAIAFRDVRNCVRDWLDVQAWDQEPRIDHFFEDHFGAAATAYTRAASRNFWLSMVARVYHPGCKVDNMIVLEGEQGIGKSRALQFIAGQWFTEQHESISGKGFFEVLQGKLLIEIGEMDSFSRADITKVKEVVTNPSDRYRESYGRYAKDHPRQCIFVGTTNKDDWNRDETGARRFWPIACRGDIDHDSIRANREQLFAEAVTRYKAGETWWEMPATETVAQQTLRYDADPWLEHVADFIGLRQDISVSEILEDCLKIEIGKVGRFDQMRVAACLRRLGWSKRAEREGAAVRKVWRPGEADVNA